MAPLNELEQKVQDALFVFVDFLYAVVFAFVLVELYEKVITVPDLSRYIKTGKIILIFGVFYFITWDWMHGRLLTLRNPFIRYRRFFIEILIAANAYGIAFSAIKGETIMLFYLAFTLLLGAWWAREALKESPSDSDQFELRFIKVYKTWMACMLFGLYFAWKFMFGKDLEWWASAGIIVMGYVFVFSYELSINRPPGLLGGPGVPYISSRTMSSIRRIFNR